MTARRDEGFTLIELLVAITILTVITSVLTAAMVVSLRTTDQASDRLSRAHDVQIRSSAFASDVQSADLVVAGAGSPPCGPSPELSFVWTDTAASPAPIVNVVSYRRDGTRLLRTHCRSGGVDASFEQVLSHGLATTQDPPQCDGGSCLTTPSKPREVSWLLVDAQAEAHTLRGTRRSFS